MTSDREREGLKKNRMNNGQSAAKRVGDNLKVQRLEKVVWVTRTESVFQRKFPRAPEFMMYEGYFTRN